MSHLYFSSNSGQMEKIDVDAAMMVTETSKRHRFFFTTLHGGAGGSHEEGEHGPHQTGQKGFTFLQFFFFFFWSPTPTPTTLFTWSIAIHIRGSLACFLFGFTLH